MQYRARKRPDNPAHTTTKLLPLQQGYSKNIQFQ